MPRASSSADPLVALRAIYGAVDRALEGWSCETSTDCCRFGITGREPYTTAVELLELDRAVRARGGLPKRRTLPLAGERRCALLGDDGRCLVYASRPLGCRTFFCDRATGPEARPPRDVLAAAARDIADLSSRVCPTDAGPRPLSRASVRWETKRRRG